MNASSKRVGSDDGAELVFIRPLSTVARSKPASVGVLRRGGATFVTRNDWIAEIIADPALGVTDQKLRDAARSTCQPADGTPLPAASSTSAHAFEVIDAGKEDLAQLKSVGAVKSGGARATLVRVEWALSETLRIIGGGAAAIASAAWLRVAAARILFKGVVPLPLTLPQQQADKAGAEARADAGADADDEDDDVGDDGSTSEGDGGEDAETAAPLLGGSEDGGAAEGATSTGGGGQKQPRSQYALDKTELDRGVLKHQIAAFEAYLTEAIHLGRARSSNLQSGVSFDNCKGWLLRFLGHYTGGAGGGGGVKGERHSYVISVGLFALLDGNGIMSFVDFLLNERGLKPHSVAQACFALQKGVGWLIAAAFDPRDPQLGDYAAAVDSLCSQVQQWATKCPIVKLSYRELTRSGAIAPLPDVIGSSVQHLQEVAAVPPPYTLKQAQGVVKAAVLAFVAGDGLPNNRPGQQQYLRHDRSADGSGGLFGAGGCLDPKCKIPNCPGSTARVLEDGAILVKIVHHKTKKVKTFTIPASTATAKVLKRLIEDAAPALRGLRDHDGLFVREDGELYEGKNAMADIAASQLKLIGFPNLNARGVRQAVVTAANDSLALSMVDKEAIAHSMGNSVRAWSAYDMRADERREEQSLASYRTLLGEVPQKEREIAATAAASHHLRTPLTAAGGGEEGLPIVGRGGTVDDDDDGGQRGEEGGQPPPQSEAAGWQNTPRAGGRGESPSPEMAVTDAVASVGAASSAAAGGRGPDEKGQLFATLLQQREERKQDVTNRKRREREEKEAAAAAKKITKEGPGSPRQWDLRCDESRPRFLSRAETRLLDISQRRSYVECLYLHKGGKRCKSSNPAWLERMCTGTGTTAAAAAGLVGEEDGEEELAAEEAD